VTVESPPRDAEVADHTAGPVSRRLPWRAGRPSFLDRPRNRRSALLLAAGACGLLLYASFPPVDAWWLAPAPVAGLALLVRGRRLRASYVLALAFGLAFFLPLLSWTSVTGSDGWIILCLAESAIFALLGPVLTLIQRLRWWPLWVAAAWVAQEALRDRQPFGGFPWGRLAFGQPHTPFTRLAAIGGAPLVTAAVALTGAALAALLVGNRRARLLAVAGLIVVPFAGLFVPIHTAAQDGNPVVAAIQGNVPDRGVDALGRKRQVLRNHAERTMQLAADVAAGRVPRPDIVLWPENSSDLDPLEDEQAAALMTRASKAIGRPILVGAVLDDGPGKVKNAGLVWGPDGFVGPIYVKQHPVPFAEYLPYRAELQKLVHRFQTLMPNDFVKGTRPGVMPYGDTTLADVICFEIAEDGIVRSAVTGGGKLLVVQTNNATFGRSGETYQQLAMTRLRAVEHGRAAVVVATSGISALVRPDGSIEARSGIYTPAALVARLPLRSSRTIADRVGAAPEWALTGVTLLAVGLAVASSVAARRRVDEEEGR
jgi:apolipoprotein N-acyltransferase